jgi:hypothetical protein
MKVVVLLDNKMTRCNRRTYGKERSCCLERFYSVKVTKILAGETGFAALGF